MRGHRVVCDGMKYTEMTASLNFKLGGSSTNRGSCFSIDCKRGLQTSSKSTRVVLYIYHRNSNAFLPVIDILDL